MQQFVERKISWAAYATITGGECRHGDSRKDNKVAGVEGNTLHWKFIFWDLYKDSEHLGFWFVTKVIQIFCNNVQTMNACESHSGVYLR